MRRLLLIDANAIIHRAYHALPPLTTPRGEPIGAVYGFTSMMLKALRELKPEFVAAAFDVPGPTFRHEAFEAYKAQRPPTPEELASQIERSKDVLEAFGIKVLTAPGFEADDIIGTVTEKTKMDKELEAIILTGDLDELQLASDNVKIHAMRRGISDIITYDTAAIKERFGFRPELITDFKALKGDPSDNIPGVPGIGEKTASMLVGQFGPLERIYETLERSPEKISASVRKKLVEHRDAAFFSRTLATIKRDAPIEISIDGLSFSGIPKDKALPLLENLGFKTLIERLG